MQRGASAWIGLVAALLLAVLLVGCPRARIVPLPTPTPTPVPTLVPTTPPTPTPTPVPTPTPLPVTFIPRKTLDVSQLFNGLKIHEQLETLPGGIAPDERIVGDSYSVDIAVKVKVPASMATLAEFGRVNPALAQSLPVLATLLPTAKVSPYYHALYDLKIRSLQQDLRTLDAVLSRHNFFDCGALLELTGGPARRKALLLQADMDVNADGSDADRYLEVDGSSMNYQPFTSYKWPKRTAVPSQFIAGKQVRILAIQTELAVPGLKPDRERVLRTSLATLKLEIEDLSYFSFLLAKADPFIVLPGFMARDKSLPFCPHIGDYAVVFYRDKAYPAIFGDIGPSDKVGEASLRLATAINPKTTANNRPTSLLDVTYLVFPGSADQPFGPPDYEKWRDRCAALLTEIGAPAVNLEHWPNILPTPTPTPSPSPTPSPTPTGGDRSEFSPVPGPSVSPNALPTPVPLDAFSAPAATITPTITPTVRP